MKPLDVSDIQDKGMKALALLASNLGWTRANARGMAIFHAPNQHELRLPTNTSIRMSVYQSRLNAIMTHSTEVPTSKLVQEIIDKVKPSATHTQRLRAVVPVEQLELPVEEPTAEAEWVVLQAEQFHQAQPEEFALVDGPATPVATTPVVEPEQPVHKEPYIVRYGRKGGQSLYRSNFIEVWTWPDGHQTLNCPWCGRSFETANGVAIHARSEHPDLIPERRSEWVQGVEATFTPGRYQDRKISEAEAMVEMIREIVGNDEAAIKEIEADRDHWKQRAEKAEGDLQALRELLNG